MAVSLIATAPPPGAAQTPRRGAGDEVPRAQSLPPERSAAERVVPSPQPASSVVPEAEYFFRATELTRPPALSGDPIIDLGEGSEALDGSIALQLFIDETGRVVSHRIDGNEGLPDEIAEKLANAFSSYRYVAGQRDGAAVKCRVTLAIAVRQGQAGMSGSP
jgi:hypothetical protein